MAEIAVKPGELAGACARARPGDTVILGDGVYREGLRPGVSGTASAPIVFKARNPGKAVIDGALSLPAPSRDSDGTYRYVGIPQVMGVWQGDFASYGKHASLKSCDYNQHGACPTLNIDPSGVSQFKYTGGTLRVRTRDGKSPQEHNLRAAGMNVAIDLNGRSYITVEGLVVQHANFFVATHGGKGIRIVNCVGRYFGGSAALWLVGLDATSELINTVVQGAGSWLGHYNDCVWVEDSHGTLIENCDISYGGHCGLTILNSTGIRLRRTHLHDMGGSDLLAKRGADDLRVEECWITGAPDIAHVDWHKTAHAGAQLSGKNGKFINCVFTLNGKSFMATSDGTQVCLDALFERCTFERTSDNGIELQQGGPLGSIARMRFVQCIIRQAAQAGSGDLLSLWLPGASKDMAGLRFDRCQITGGQIRGTNGTFQSVADAARAMPAVYVNCSANTVAGAGSRLSMPPSPGVPPQPPDPGPQPPPPLPPEPPPAGETVITALEPVTGQAGSVVTIRGQGFGTHPLVIVSADIPGGLYRLTDGEIRSAADTAIQIVMPKLVKSGPVYVRGIGTSNKVEFTVGGGPTPAALSVIVAAEARASGGLATATITDADPLPRGTKVAVTVTRPDGKAATGETTL